MKVLFDTRLYVYDNELRDLGQRCSLYIMERPDMSDVGGIRNATSVPIQQKGHKLERVLARLGLQLTIPTYIKNYEQILNQIKPDILVISEFFYLSSLQALHYKKKNPEIRLILISETKHWPDKWLAKIFMKVMLKIWQRHNDLVDKIIVYTEHGKDFFAQQWPQMKSVTLPPTIDTQVFRPAFGREFLVNDTLHLIINARYYPYKRHMILLEALAQLQQAGYKFLLTCVSRDATGKEAIIDAIEKLNIAKNVTFSPTLSQPELVRLMAKQDILVLPSRHEALGMVVPEAMACGVSTITSDTVGANIYVKEGETGFIFKTDDMVELIDCLRSCYNKEQISKMGTLAEQAIREHHTAANQSQRLAQEII